MGGESNREIVSFRVVRACVRACVCAGINRGADKKLDVKIAPEGGTTVPGMACVVVESMEDVLALLETGQRNRSVGCTNMNEHSSRSHMILSIHTCNTNCVTGAKGYGKLHLIDLAGPNP